MSFNNTQYPKLCHAKVGDVVRLLDASGEALQEMFIISCHPEKGRRAARPGMTQGLYDDERSLFLVSLATGESRAMPHLSSRSHRAVTKDAVALKSVAILATPTPDTTVRLRVVRDTTREVAEWEVNIDDPQAVRVTFDALRDQAARITEVTTSESRSAARQAAWREAVCNGNTLLSFAEFDANSLN